MNDDQLDELFGKARGAGLDTSRLEYGFETRLLARIRASREHSGNIFGWAWRLCPYFAGIVAALGVWAWFSPAPDPEALAKTGEENSPMVEFFTGERI
jgi:hypothetical protein